MKSKKISFLICILFILNSCFVVESFNLSDEFTSFINNQKEDSVEHWEEKYKLIAPDGTKNDSFGYSVSIDNDTAIIGAPLHNKNGTYSGSAYVFRNYGDYWEPEQKLFPLEGKAGDHFGYSVSIDGDTALIGADLYDEKGNNSGAAFVYTCDGTNWSQQAKLVASDGEEFDYFGCSVSLDGDTALIGAFGDDNEDNDDVDSGSAYVFTRDGTNWSQQAKLLASDGWYWDYFGCSVSLDADTALIGAFEENDYDYGASYVFTCDGTNWSQQAKLTASDGEEFDWFGCSVSLDGDTALIGAFGDDDKGNESGSAYIFLRDGTTWTRQDKITASDGEEGDKFGFSVSLDDNTALVGAYHDDDKGEDSGSSYVFITSNGIIWEEQDKINASDGEEFDWFGCSVSLDGYTALIGVDHDDDNLEDSGSAYIFIKENTAPDTPGRPEGPTKVKVGVEYEWCCIASDPDNDSIYYWFDWYDGDSGWLGPYNSGEECCATHIYDEKGSYVILVKVKDVHEAISEWSEPLEVEVPRNKEVTNTFIISLFERYLNLYPIFRYILGF